MFKRQKIPVELPRLGNWVYTAILFKQISQFAQNCGTFELILGQRKMYTAISSNENEFRSQHYLNPAKRKAITRLRNVKDA